MRNKTEVYLLAENRLLREALLRLLSKRSEIDVVGANSYSQSVPSEVIAANPQIILLDSYGLLFDKSSLIPKLTSAIPSARIVMVDMDADETTFLASVRAGVVGYILKDASALEVTATIRAVAEGEAVCPPSLSMALFRSIARQKKSEVPDWGSSLGLSRREQQMVGLLRERLTNKEIASRLNLSEQTVKNHVHRILRKLGAPHRNGIVELCSAPRPPHANSSATEMFVSQLSPGIGQA